MAFQINSIGVANSLRNLSISDENTAKSIEALSSGSSINSAADNASGLAIANQLMSQVSGYGQEIMNANDSIGMIQIADGAMNEQNNIMDRINTLTLKASNATMSASDRASIQKEIDRLTESSNNIANTTSYNGMGLLNGSGATPYTKDTTTNSLFPNGIDVTTQAGAEQALSDIQTATSSLGDMRSDLGSVQNQLVATVNNLTTGAINAAAAQSQISDLDFAAESANFNKQNLLTQTGSFALAQSNAVASNTASLLQ